MIKKMILFILAMSVYQRHTLLSQQWMETAQNGKLNLYEAKKAFETYWQGKNIKDQSVVKGKGWKPFKRWEWFMEPRVNGEGYLDPAALWHGWTEKQRLFPEEKRNTSVNWVNLGPESSYPVGGGAGRVNCIAFDPFDPDIVWAGSPSGGLWKSVNGGATWNNSWDDLPNLGISSIVIDHKNPDTMYVATGDGDAGDTYSIGVLKSTDGGSTWFTTGLSYAVSSGIRIRKLVMHPVNNRFLIMAASDGLYYTADGGSSWNQPRTGGFYDIEMFPGNSDIWYAAQGTKVFKSTNAGTAWFASGSGLPTTGLYRIALAVTPSAPGYVYALICNNTDYGFKGFYISRDSAKTWIAQNTTKNILGWNTSGSDAGGQGWYDLVTAASPADSLTVFAGGVNIWKSTNGGVTWVLNAHWYGGGGKPYVHADQHVFEYVPGTENLWAGHDGGINKTTDGGTTWQDLSYGLGIHQFYRIGLSRSNPRLMYGGTQDNGTDRYSSGIWTNVYGGDGMEALVDYSDENIAYGELYYGDMFRTMNGGASWASVNNGVLEDGAWVTPFIIHPDSAEILYKATTRIYKTTDRGTWWFPVSNVLSGNTITSLAIAAKNPLYMYASNASYVYRTTNGGVKWDTIVNSGISYMAVHPDEPEIVYVTKSNYSSGQKVFKSTNAGADWINLSAGLPNIPFNCVTLHPDNGNHVYTGSELGVFHSSDAGFTWETYNQGLPNVIVNELEIHSASGKLRAGTYGRGLWETEISLVGIQDDITEKVPDRNMLHQNYPNPFNPVTTIRYELHSGGDVKLDVYNTLGQQVRTLVQQKQGPGFYTVIWDGKNSAGNNVSSGIYLYKLFTGKESVSRKMILMR